MSTSLLYYAFGIVGYFYQNTRYIAGAIIVSIQIDDDLGVLFAEVLKCIVEENRLAVFARYQLVEKRCLLILLFNG
jgi:hypothetical protein